MTRPPAHEVARGFIPPVAWLALIAGLSVWAADRLGAFDLWASVATASGEVRFPNGFAIVDHPFHAVRAETLRRALADGELLRWIGHHQGGYPAEFYPLGVAWLEVAVWAALLGQLPMMAVHKVTVTLIFLLPAIAYAWFARVDRRVLGVALLATAGHLVVRGWWWSGGAMELIEWGLVTNVAGATAALLALPAFARFVSTGAVRAGGLAATLGAAALFCNPRSGIALAAVAGGALVVALGGGKTARAPVVRLLVVGGLTALLAAPLIVSLARFGELYHFVHYSGYDNVSAYLDSSVRATGGPAFVLGLLGFVVPWLEHDRPLSRAVSATAALYVAATLYLALVPWPASLIDQLEATRLMPFQRLLWFWLAAVGFEWLVRLGAGAFSERRRAHLVDAALLAAGAATVVLYVAAPPAFIPESDRGLVRMPTTAHAGIVDLETAVRTADAAAIRGTALLVLGTSLSWHDQLWGPLWSDRPFFYDDWLWYWHRDHFGDYDPERGHAYPEDASALRPDYLRAHGIGAVVVTGSAGQAARGADWLELRRDGIWDVYVVREPVTVVTFDGANATSIRVDRQAVSAAGNGGDILVRRNWFPRWNATVDGEPVPIERTADGYVRIEAGEGEHRLELSYGVDPIDWLARLASVLGLIGAGAMLIGRAGGLATAIMGPETVRRRSAVRGTGEADREPPQRWLGGSRAAETGRACTPAGPIGDVRAARLIRSSSRHVMWERCGRPAPANREAIPPAER